MYDFFEFFSGRRVAGQKVRKSVFSCLRHSRDHVQRARAVLTSPGATPEAQGARRSGRTEVGARGLSARRNPRCGQRVKRPSREPPAPPNKTKPPVCVVCRGKTGKAQAKYRGTLSHQRPDGSHWQQQTEPRLAQTRVRYCIKCSKLQIAEGTAVWDAGTARRVLLSHCLIVVLVRI